MKKLCLVLLWLVCMALSFILGIRHALVDSVIYEHDGIISIILDGNEYTHGNGMQ